MREFTVDVWVNPSRHLRGRLVRKVGDLLTLEFDAGLRLDLNVGDHIEWTDRTAKPSAPRCAGDVTEIREGIAFDQIVVKLSSEEDAPATRRAGRKRLVHPRTAFRVRPRPDDQMVVSIKDDLGTISGRVRDLSIDGLGVYVGGTIAIGTTVIVTLPLPGSGGVLRLTGNVVRSNRLSHGTLLGILFDASVSGFSAQQNVLHAFVVQKQGAPPSIPAVRPWEEVPCDLGSR